MNERPLIEQMAVAYASEIEELKADNARLRAALEMIGWMDEFLDADGAKAMMKIARAALNEETK